MRDLEPIQGRSLVDFPDYVIRDRKFFISDSNKSNLFIFY